MMKIQTNNEIVLMKIQTNNWIVLMKIQINTFLPNPFMQVFLHSLPPDYLYFFGYESHCKRFI
ncbi:MAG TPA: hypothetical protein DCS17_01605 [Flavobacterium sp.]|nr:hypothetical protein [Flavobacterium sp.]